MSAEPAPENPVVGTKKAEFRELPCRLSAVELEERANSLAIDQGYVDQQELEKAEDAATYSNRLRLTRARMSRTAKELRDRQTIRSVEVRDTILAEENVMVTNRVDTGEEITRRPLTEAERQRSLFHVEPTPLAEAVAGAKPGEIVIMDDDDTPLNEGGERLPGEHFQTDPEDGGGEPF